MSAYERINVTVSITLIGLALYFVLDFPAKINEYILFGSPLLVKTPYQWLMMILLGAMAMAGTDTVIRVHPHLLSKQLNYLSTFWMLPGLLVILATQTLGLAPSVMVWAVGVGVVGVLLWLTIYTEYRQVLWQSEPDLALWPRLWRYVVGYTIALVFFIVIYQTRSRSIISATAILLISSMVALGLLRQTPENVWKTWLFASIIGLSLGQTTWALNYWHTGALNAGLLLFLFFYLFVGLAQQQIMGTLARKTVWEFGAIASVGLVIIYLL